MIRLSFLEFIKPSEISAPSRCVVGRAISPDPDFEAPVLERIEGRFLGAVGAWRSGLAFMPNMMEVYSYHDHR